jgi:hypothetical protein
MYNFKNPHGATPALIKEQELEDNLIKAEFAWNDAKTLDEKKKALELVNSALGEIEKFHNEKVAKKPNLYFDVDPSLIPTMMHEMEARIIKHERLQNWQNPEWMDEQLDELSNLKEMGYSESEASKYVGILGNSVREVREIIDLDVEWDNQSWEEQRG